MATFRHLGFSNLGNFNGGLAVGVQDASLCQISSKSITWLPRYSDCSIFQNGSCPPSWICTFGWEMLIPTPKIGVLGRFDPLNGEQYQCNPQKAHPCMETRHDI